MPIQFRCQFCRQRLGIADSRAGTLVDCPACGRSLKVPSIDGQIASAPPEHRAADSQLQSALQLLTAFGTESPAVPSEPPAPQTPPHQTSPKSTLTASPPKIGSKSAALLNTALQTPANPPLAELATLPVTLDEPPLLAQPHLLDDVTIPEHQDDSSASTTIPAGTSTDAANSQLATALTELAAQQPAAHATADAPRSPFHPYFPILIPLLTALLAFFTGILVANSRHGSTAGTSPRTSADADTDLATVSPEQSQPAPTPPAANHIEGTVFAQTADGRTEPDAGALLIIAPAKNTSQLRLDGRFLRDDQSTVAHKALTAALREFDVSFAFAGADGSFSLPLPRNGSCTLIAVSKRIARPAAMPLADTVAASLAEWFTTPSPITGRLHAVTQNINVPAPGEGVRQDITIAVPSP